MYYYRTRVENIESPPRSFVIVLTGEKSADQCSPKWCFSLGIDFGKNAEQQSVGGHGVQDSGQREKSTDHTGKTKQNKNT